MIFTGVQEQVGVSTPWLNLVEWFLSHRFVDASGMTERETAETINKAGVTALMDLNGWSGGLRTGIIAERPAAVQVTCTI